jgi:GNAT superfamily N-acetyltransferase
MIRRGRTARRRRRAVQDDGLRDVASPVDEDPPARDLQFLEDRINEYNVATTGIPFGGQVAVFVRDEDGAIIAGLYGWMWGGCLEVRDLWVHQDHRGKGHGTRLLSTAEQHALTRGCHQVLLSTHSFQAPGFYMKLGYETCGTVDGYPRGHAKWYLKKSLI